MREAADQGGKDPGRVSFVSLLFGSHAAPSPGAALFPTDDRDATETTWFAAIVRLFRRLNPVGRHRSNSHLIKRRMPSGTSSEPVTRRGPSPPNHPSSYEDRS
jgi:hypothetical protein